MYFYLIIKNGKLVGKFNSLARAEIFCEDKSNKYKIVKVAKENYKKYLLDNFT